MKRFLIVFAASLLAFLGLAGVSLSTQAQFSGGGVGTIEGTVLDPQGKPVTNASVTIQTSYGTHPHATHTDANGHFEFARWTSGQYDLRAYANGVFSEWAKREVIKAKKTTEVTLRLLPAQQGAN
jgi:Carboxypeptidase regulatory-like domain